VEAETAFGPEGKTGNGQSKVLFAGNLGGQALAALSATALQNRATRGRLHAFSETVTAAAFGATRL
jgi:hypothetical protein